MNPADLERITALRHELHQHPELSGQEGETAQRLMRFLRENAPGALRIGARDGWFFAEIPGTDPAGRKAAAFRADMDALPVPETIPLPWASQV